MEDGVKNHLEGINAMEDLDDPENSENQKDIKDDVSTICVTSGIVNDVEDESRTNDDCVKHVPVFRDEHRESKSINLQQYFECKDGQEAPFNIFITGKDYSGIDQDYSIKQIPEIFVLHCPNQHFRVFVLVNVGDVSL